jgi:hypothetical protein
MRGKCSCEVAKKDDRFWPVASRSGIICDYTSSWLASDADESVVRIWRDHRPAATAVGFYESCRSTVSVVSAGDTGERHHGEPDPLAYRPGEPGAVDPVRTREQRADSPIFGSARWRVIPSNPSGAPCDSRSAMSKAAARLYSMQRSS